MQAVRQNHGIFAPPLLAKNGGQTRTKPPVNEMCSVPFAATSSVGCLYKPYSSFCSRSLGTRFSFLSLFLVLPPTGLCTTTALSHLLLHPYRFLSTPLTTLSCPVSSAHRALEPRCFCALPQRRYSSLLNFSGNSIPGFHIPSVSHMEGT